jgi:hypothetical protein
MQFEHCTTYQILHHRSDNYMPAGALSVELRCSGVLGPTTKLHPKWVCSPQQSTSLNCVAHYVEDTWRIESDDKIDAKRYKTSWRKDTAWELKAKPLSFQEGGQAAPHTPDPCSETCYHYLNMQIKYLLIRLLKMTWARPTLTGGKGTQQQNGAMATTTTWTKDKQTTSRGRRQTEDNDKWRRRQRGDRAGDDWRLQPTCIWEMYIRKKSRSHTVAGRRNAKTVYSTWSCS